MREPTTHTAKYQVGQVIRHLRFDYRGVVADIDAVYQGSEEWYEVVARSRPPKDKPWYHVLVHGAEHTTYVAERHLAPDESGEAIQHPLVHDVFASFEAGRYMARQRAN